MFLVRLRELEVCAYSTFNHTSKTTMYRQKSDSARLLNSSRHLVFIGDGGNYEFRMVEKCGHLPSLSEKF